MIPTEEMTTTAATTQESKLNDHVLVLYPPYDYYDYELTNFSYITNSKGQ